MRLLIWHKLFLALLVATTIAVVTAMLLTRWSFNRGFLDYVNSVETQRADAISAELSAIYAATGSWSDFASDHRNWGRLMDQFNARPPAFSGEHPPPPSRSLSGELRTPPPGRARPGSRESLRERDRSADRRGGRDFGRENGRAPPEFRQTRRGPSPEPPGRMGFRQPIDLLDADGRTLFGNPEPAAGTLRRPIVVDSRTVGYIRYLPVSALTELDEDAEQRFLDQQRSALWPIAAVSISIAALLALLFGRRLVAPIRTLTRGTRALASGQYEQRVEVASRDELGQLAHDFNTLAGTLETNRSARRQWIVDISHELRTPLAILNAELQAVEDGVRPLNQGAIASLQTEVSRLVRLVNDLHELSLSDAGGLAYQRSEVDLTYVIEQAVDSYRHRIEECHLQLDAQWPQTPILLYGDARRLEQLIINLLENSCRYTDAGGSVRLRCIAGNTVKLVVEDSAPGVPAAELPRLFDRLYRVESSRSRAHGGSGLGLAICESIVEAHGGTIKVSASTLGGLRTEVELPIESN